MIGKFVFFLVVVLIGFVLMSFFDRWMKKTGKKYPKGKNPIHFWLFGRYEDDDDEKPQDRDKK